MTFTWQGVRRRETLDIPATAANIKYAARLRAEVQNAIERGTFDYGKFFPGSSKAEAPSPQTTRQTVGELVDAFIDRARKAQTLAPSSIACYARWNKARIKKKWGETPIDELTTPALRAWIAELAEKLAPKSVRNCVGVLSTVLSEATTDSIISSNPLAPITIKVLLPKKRKSKDKPDKIDPFNPDEIAAILSAAPSPQERAMIQFAFSTGVRIGELIAVKWDNIGMRTRTVRIEDNVTSSEIGTVEKDTKTEGSERDISLIPPALAAIETMRPISQFRSPYIFTHPKDGGRWLNEHQYRNRWRIILRKAGVRYRNPYQTRHTFASTLLMNGEPELLVAKLLGHTTVEMVRRHYARWIPRPEGIQLRGDYSELGAHLGHVALSKSALNVQNRKRKA